MCLSSMWVGVAQIPLVGLSDCPSKSLLAQAPLNRAKSGFKEKLAFNFAVGLIKAVLE